MINALHPTWLWEAADRWNLCPSLHGIEYRPRHGLEGYWSTQHSEQSTAR